ncbi:Hypothetical predicted protein, partial [Pelobates cultripes]
TDGGHPGPNNPLLLSVTCTILAILVIEQDCTKGAEWPNKMADAHVEEPRGHTTHSVDLTGSHNNIGDQLEALFNCFWAALEERRRLQMMDKMPLLKTSQNREVRFLGPHAGKTNPEVPKPITPKPL